MTKRVEQLPLTVERLERALVLLAYFIELDGDVHLSMYEKFEGRTRRTENERSHQISRAAAPGVLSQ